MKLKNTAKVKTKKKIKEAKKCMLHIGGGNTYFHEWINIDDNSDKSIEMLDLDWDLTKSLPFKDNSVDLVYDKHFYGKMELGHELIERVLWNYRCMLKPDGLFRISIPFIHLKQQLETWLVSLGFSNVEFLDPMGVNFDDMVHGTINNKQINNTKMFSC